MPRNTQMTVEIVNGELVVRIGIDILCFAVKAGQNWPDEAVIYNNDEFAKDIKKALLNEAEDGTTALHRVFDLAADYVAEYGDSVSYPD